jgi:acetyl-CoA carboxylase carboxyl transferase subunit beta
VDPHFWRNLSRGTFTSVQRISALEAVAAIADPDSLHSWEGPGIPIHADSPGYSDELARAAAATGAPDSVISGAVRIGGIPAAVIAWEFGFLGGSVGVRTASRIVAAVRRATAEGLPLVALPRSGGTRMQEGAPAFVQMVAITGAIAEHRAAGLPYLVHLCGPTTGGVLATMGSVGDITTAEPGAMVGFLGPRAYAAITGREFPEGIQTAENLLARGIVDAILPWPDLRDRWRVLLRLWADRPRSPGAARLGAGPGPAPAPAPRAPAPRAPAPRAPAPRPSRDPVDRAPAVPGAPQTPAELWRYVAASRAHDRIDSGQFVTAHMSDVVWLPGTAAGDVANGAAVGVGRLEGMPVVVAATEDRWTGEPLTVGGLRTIRRGIDLAGRWGLPIVTIVDTLGAQLSVEGEQAGIAGEIARVMLDLVRTPSPTAALLLGAGTGGAALAMLAADRIVAGSHTWVSPLAPEGAAAIRHVGPHDPVQIAWEQRIGAHALASIGFVDTIVRESEPDWVGALAREIVAGLEEVLAGVDPHRRVERFAAWGAPA